MKAIASFVFWFLWQLLWNKVLTTTTSPLGSTPYNPTSVSTYRYATFSGTNTPDDCIISLDGKEGIFGDKLTSEKPSGPSESPTLISISPITSFMTSPTTSPTISPATSSSGSSACIEYKQWKITVPEGHYIEMTLESIHLGPGACFYEMYLTVKDGPSRSSNVLHIQCEPDDQPRRIWSSGNEMLVERHGSSSRSSADTGFKARYQAKLLSKGGLYVVPSPHVL